MKTLIGSLMIWGTAKLLAAIGSGLFVSSATVLAVIQK